MAVVGLGRAGRTMLPYIESHPLVAVAATADGAADFAEVLKRRDLDAVYLATPTALHAEQAMAALDGGFHVVVEKPMALTLEEADTMVASAGRTGRALIVGPSHAYEPAVGMMAALSRRYGPVRMATTVHYSDWARRPRAHVPESVALRQGSHQVDMVRTVTGQEVVEVGGRRFGSGAYMAHLRLSEGAVATLVYSGEGRLPGHELTFGVGEGGREGPDPLPAPDSPYQPQFGLTLVSCEGADLRPSPQGVLVYRDGWQHHEPVGDLPPGRHRLLDHLVGATEGKAAPFDGRWGRETLRVCLEIASLG